MTVYAYYRVSTDRQDYESQKVGVVDYCKRCGHTIDKEVIDDGVSGTVKAKDRKLWKIVKNARKGDWLITSELSRLGRSTSDVLNTCAILGKNGVNVWFVKQGMGLDQTPMGKMMLAILSAFAEMERDLISQRTTEALKRKKELGIPLGRPKGNKNSSYKLDEHKELIMQMLYNKASIGKISRTVKCDRKTVIKYCNLRDIKLPERGASKCSILDSRLYQIIKDREAGLSFDSIGARYGVSGSVACYWYAKNKKRIDELYKKREMKKLKAAKPTKEQIMERYKNVWYG